MLEKIKKRLGISPSVTVYDDELSDLIEDAKLDMLMSGIPIFMVQTEPPTIINTIVLFIKKNGFDETDVKKIEQYSKMYDNKVLRLSLFDNPEEVPTV